MGYFMTSSVAIQHSNTKDAAEKDLGASTHVAPQLRGIIPALAWGLSKSIKHLSRDSQWPG
jgi:hypothetical protein